MCKKYNLNKLSNSWIAIYKGASCIYFTPFLHENYNKDAIITDRVTCMVAKSFVRGACRNAWSNAPWLRSFAIGLLAHDPSSSLAYPKISHTPLVAGNLPTKTLRLVGNDQQLVLSFIYHYSINSHTITILFVYILSPLDSSFLWNDRLIFPSNARFILGTVELIWHLCELWKHHACFDTVD